MKFQLLRPLPRPSRRGHLRPRQPPHLLPRDLRKTGWSCNVRDSDWEPGLPALSTPHPLSYRECRRDGMASWVGVLCPLPLPHCAPDEAITAPIFKVGKLTPAGEVTCPGTHGEVAGPGLISQVGTAVCTCRSHLLQLYLGAGSVPSRTRIIQNWLCEKARNQGLKLPQEEAGQSETGQHHPPSEPRDRLGRKISEEQPGTTTDPRSVRAGTAFLSLTRKPCTHLSGVCESRARGEADPSSHGPSMYSLCPLLIP